jgi:hypothetical protein
MHKTAMKAFAEVVAYQHVCMEEPGSMAQDKLKKLLADFTTRVITC